MNTNDTNKTSNAAVTWEGRDAAPRKEPGRWAVAVGYYVDAAGCLLLLPVLYYRHETDTEAGNRSPKDWVFIGPVYRRGELGFDLLSKTAGDFLPLFSPDEDLPSLPVDARRRPELVLLVGPDPDRPDWVTVGVRDGRAVRAVGFAFRFDETQVAEWLWTSGLPRVAAKESASRC